MLHRCSRLSLAVVALFAGLTAAMPAAWAAGPATQKTVTPLATPAPTPTPTPLPPQATLCNLNTCISVCQMNNPERGVKETCAPSCTTLIQNRKTEGVCAK